MKLSIAVALAAAALTTHEAHAEVVIPQFDLHSMVAAVSAGASVAHNSIDNVHAALATPTNHQDAAVQHSDQAASAAFRLTSWLHKVSGVTATNHDSSNDSSEDGSGTGVLYLLRHSSLLHQHGSSSGSTDGLGSVATDDHPTLQTPHPQHTDINVQTRDGSGSHIAASSGSANNHGDAGAGSGGLSLRGSSSKRHQPSKDSATTQNNSFMSTVKLSDATNGAAIIAAAVGAIAGVVGVVVALVGLRRVRRSDARYGASELIADLPDPEEISQADEEEDDPTEDAPASTTDELDDEDAVVAPLTARSRAEEEGAFTNA